MLLSLWRFIDSIISFTKIPSVLGGEEFSYTLLFQKHRAEADLSGSVARCARKPLRLTVNGPPSSEKSIF